MRTIRMTAVFLLLTVLVVGCSEQPLPTASGDTPIAEPALNFMNGPAEPGMSGVFRVQDIFLITSSDPDGDLLAVHFQADDFLFCGGSNFFEFADVQRVNNQEDIEREVNRLVDAPIFIYKLSDFPPVPGPARCAFLANDWLYKGIHTVTGHDNDFHNAGPGAKVLGYSGSGTVYDRAGDRYRYSENQLLLFSPDEVFGFFITEKIRVTRTGAN